MIKRKSGEIVTYDTRSEANEKVNRELRYAQILECLEVGPMTAKEIAVVLFNRGLIPTSERNFTAPRLTELAQRGVVEPIGKERCRYTGRTVAVYALREAE